jgi:hypothetical protein
MKSHEIRRLELVLDKIEAGIARESSCASVLVAPRRKPSLVENFHREATAELKLYAGHGSSPGEEGRGRGERSRGRTTSCEGGGGGAWRGLGPLC